MIKSLFILLNYWNYLHYLKRVTSSSRAECIFINDWEKINHTCLDSLSLKIFKRLEVDLASRLYSYINEKMKAKYYCRFLYTLYFIKIVSLHKTYKASVLSTGGIVIEEIKMDFVPKF